VTALMNLAGVGQQEMYPPRSMIDLHRLGVECRREGSELVIQWDSDFRV
jgi:hypothetical protein